MNVGRRETESDGEKGLQQIATPLQGLCQRGLRLQHIQWGVTGGGEAGDGVPGAECLEEMNMLGLQASDSQEHDSCLPRDIVSERTCLFSTSLKSRRTCVETSGRWPWAQCREELSPAGADQGHGRLPRRSPAPRKTSRRRQDFL